MKKNTFNYIIWILCLLLFNSTYAVTISSKPTPTIPINNLQYNVISFFVDFFVGDELTNHENKRKTFLYPNNALSKLLAITPPDNTSSTVSCPSLAVDPGPPIDIITDSCPNTISASLIGSIETPNPVTCEGTIVWTYRYTDGCDFTFADWTHTYTIDTPTFAITDPNGSSTVNCIANATETFSLPTVTDVCGNTLSPSTAVITENPNPLTCEGTRTYTYTYTDCASNSDTWAYTYTIDLASPTVPSNGSSVVECIGDATQVPAPIVTDSCGNNLTAVITENVDPVPACGTNKIYSYTYTDCANNVSIYTYTYTVIDTIAPTASNPAPVNVQCSVDVPSQNILDVIGEADNCTINPVVAFLSDVSDGNSSPEIITRTYSVTDTCGNSMNVYQTITINDITSPIITCPTPDASYNTDAGQCDATLSFNATATDNCNGSPGISYNISGTPITFPHNFPVGTTTVTAVANDGNGQTDSCNFNVVVVDNESPTFLFCPLDISIDNDIDTCGAIVTYNAPTASDNCGVQSIVQTDVSGLSSGSTFPFGTTTLEYTVTDINGNSIICSFIVTVNDTQDPDTPPLPLLTDECSLTVTAPTTTDNCTGTITGTNGDYSFPHTFNSDGTYIISWLFDDGNGNSFTMDQTVIIDDVTSPIPNLLNLPAISEVDCEVDVPVPTATDNCRGTINGDPTDADGNDVDFPITTFGTTIITWTYDDGNGQEVTQQQSVTLTKPPISGGVLLGQLDSLDTIEFPPSNNVPITACPDNINPVTINLSGENGTIVRWEKFEAGSQNWDNIANTTNTYHIDFDVSNSLSTVYRVLVQYGTCFEYSQIMSVHAVPPDVPPTLENDYFNECLGTEIELIAYSGYTGIVDPSEEDAGQFDQGQFPDKWNPNMWKIDGLVAGVSFTGAANNRSVNNWTATNNHPFPDGTWEPKIEYDSNNFKFAIAQGDFTSQEYIDAFPPGNATTLETPIMSLAGLESPSFSFTTAWNLFPGDTAILEISLDGGLTYEPVPLWDLTAPIIPWDWAGNPPSTADNYIFDNNVVSFDLSGYSPNDQIRIKWTFFGTTPFSAWAIDEITLPLGGSPTNDIEWTDGIGNPNEDPLADGVLTAAFNFTPDAPGAHQYGATVLVNGCRAYDPAGTALADVLINYAYAGEDIVYTDGDCGENIVTLNAYDNTKTAIENAAKGAFTLPNDCKNCDDPGTMTPGKWTAVPVSSTCGSNYSFSNDTDPNATFTGDPGTYTLTWTVGPFGLDNLGYCNASVTVQITNCARVDFDGENDNVTFRNNYNLNSDFSIECWIKPDAITNTGGTNNPVQTIISKRNANNYANTGYDLKLVNNTLSFNWNNTGSISSPIDIDTDRWYHVAVTRRNTGKVYRMYIDGIEVVNDTGNEPSSNNDDCILGAMDQQGVPPNQPVNYFSGWIDEVRIWNKTLSVEHIRQMMNQQIDESGGNVIGEVIPIIVSGLDADGDSIDDNPLTWANLVGYYRMNEIDCGYLEAYKGVIDGKIRNVTTPQEESAPLPYTTIQPGNWNDISGNSPWTYGSTVWDHPNSMGINGDPIDWNIVRTGHDVISNTQDITLLGLAVDTAELTITNNTGAQDETNPGHALNITHYLLLDGLIDLIGESQLVQKRYTPSQFSESILDSGSTGHLERDQQGQSNIFNYNYWSSPVSPSYGSSYNVSSILKDGTNSANPVPLLWTNSYDANPATTGKTLSRRWIWAYENYVTNQYANWRYLQETSTIAPGLSFTMKGSGAAGNEQNYVFDGMPHNGTTTTPITFGNEALVGNPYPSAIDAIEFIRDNIPGGNPGTSSSIDGTLYFWIHYTTNDTHILRDYQGGYAQFNLSGGNIAITPPITADGYVISGLGSSALRPDQYIPVGQGFFVGSLINPTGGNITFKNSQRIFRTEQASSSVFLKSGNTKNAKGNQNPPTAIDEQAIKRIRFQFITPEKASRPLLLAFTPDDAATDGFDYGYDAKNTEMLPNDMLFTIEDDSYIIQGVGAFDETKQYPFGIFSTTGGYFEIALTELENLHPSTKVYIYDSLLGTYTKINNKNFEITLDAGDYINRFFITFVKDNSLSVRNEELGQISVNYLNNSSEIHIKTPNNIDIKQVYLTNILGQTIKSWNVSNTPSFSNDMKIPVSNIAEGGYIIKVLTNTGITNKKIIVKQ